MIVRFELEMQKLQSARATTPRVFALAAAANAAATITIRWFMRALQINEHKLLWCVCNRIEIYVVSRV